MPPLALTSRQIQKFRKGILGYYKKEGRDLPWRKNITPYRVVVSEIMLQQTQVERVERYYPKFLKVFPDWRALAGASPKEVLSVWQGMGYNRRALNLLRLAREVKGRHGGKLPQNPDELAKLPGIGRATAGAILAYAFNVSAPFIETNIRRTFIHWFFKNKKAVHDREILSLVAETLDRRNPRRWYSALTDYGAALSAIPSLSRDGNPNRKSVHYAKQSPFKGSRRQIRGKILKFLLASPLTGAELSRETGKSKPDIIPILAELSREGFIKKYGKRYHIP